MVFLEDLRHAVRLFRANPAFSAVAVLTLALGIGATTAVFSVVSGVLLRPLPYPDSDHLVEIMTAESSKSELELPVSALDFRDWREQSEVFESMVGTYRENLNLSGDFEAERVEGTWVSAGFFRMMRMDPVVGRGFLLTEDQPGEEFVAVISDGLWRRRFGGSPEILGETLRLNGEPYAVVGVAPPGFQFPRQTDVWMPLGIDYNEERRGSGWLAPIARLSPGVSLLQAQSEMRQISDGLALAYPETNKHRQAAVTALAETLVQQARPALLLLMGAVGSLFLIAEVNVTNLLLALAMARSRETAIRQALGAGRGRLLSQYLTECTLLSLTGAVGGVLLATSGTPVLVRLFQNHLPPTAEVGVNGPVLAFALTLAVAGGIVVGLATALWSTRFESSTLLQQAGRTDSRERSRMRSLLVVAEVALALVLLVGATVLMRTVFNLLDVDPGFSRDNILTMEISLAGDRYGEEAAMAGFFAEVLDDLQSLPGVRSAASVYPLPLFGRRITVLPLAEGEADPGVPDRQRAELRLASAGYAETLGLRLVEGRFLAKSDTLGAPEVAVVNSTFVKSFFSGRNPVGLRLTLDTDLESEDLEWITVVGVVDEVRHVDLASTGDSELYLSTYQHPFEWATIALRVDGEPTSLAGPARAVIRKMDPDLPVFNVQTMDEIVGRSLGWPRSTMALVGTFALLAVTLAAIGIYGVLNFSVSQRRREMGIRMALGAQQIAVLTLVVRQGLKPVTVGIGLGLAGVLALRRLVESQLYGVGTTDPAVLAGSSIVLLVAGLAACLFPAWRATRIDPMTALRTE